MYTYNEGSLHQCRQALVFIPVTQRHATVPPDSLCAYPFSRHECPPPPLLSQPTWW